MTVHIMTACAGFLLAVLWMDLIFDTQIARWGRGGKEGPRPHWNRSAAITAGRRQPHGR